MLNLFAVFVHRHTKQRKCYWLQWWYTRADLGDAAGSVHPPHQSVMPFLSAAPLSEKNAGSVPGTSLPVVIVKSLCFCHPTEDNKYPHLKVPQEGLKKLYIFDETNYHFSLFTWGRTENQRKMVFPCKKMLDYVNHGRSLVISLFTFQFKIYLK